LPTSSVRRTCAAREWHGVKNRLPRPEGNTELARARGLGTGHGRGDETRWRSVLDAIRPYRTVAVRGAILGGRRVDAESVTRLATLPSREVLLGQLAGGMVAPLASMASLLAAPLRNLGYALAQVAERKARAEAA
jgi:hypothetical protein